MLNVIQKLYCYCAYLDKGYGSVSVHWVLYDRSTSLKMMILLRQSHQTECLLYARCPHSRAHRSARGPCMHRQLCRQADIKSATTHKAASGRPFFFLVEESLGGGGLDVT